MKALKILLSLSSQEKQSLFFEAIQPPTQTDISQVELWELLKDILSVYSNSKKSVI